MLTSLPAGWRHRGSRQDAPVWPPGPAARIDWSRLICQEVDGGTLIPFYRAARPSPRPRPRPCRATHRSIGGARRTRTRPRPRLASLSTSNLTGRASANILPGNRPGVRIELCRDSALPRAAPPTHIKSRKRSLNLRPTQQLRPAVRSVSRRGRSGKCFSLVRCCLAVQISDGAEFLSRNLRRPSHIPCIRSWCFLLCSLLKCSPLPAPARCSPESVAATARAPNGRDLARRLLPPRQFI